MTDEVASQATDLEARALGRPYRSTASRGRRLPRLQGPGVRGSSTPTRSTLWGGNVRELLPSAVSETVLEHITPRSTIARLRPEYELQYHEGLRSLTHARVEARPRPGSGDRAGGHRGTERRSRSGAVSVSPH
jgi:hypothetical protein